jgi:hypothetical protein
MRVKKAGSKAKARRRRAATLMLVDFGLPIGLYYGLRAMGVGYLPSLLIGSLVPSAGMVVTLVRERKLDSAGFFMTVVMLASAGLSVISGSTRLLLAKDALLMVAVGGWFLVTVRGSQPLVLRFSRPLLEGRIGAREESWDDLWARSPDFRRLWRVCTVAWGVGSLVDAVVRVVIVYTLPIDLAVGLGGVQYGIFTVLMLVIVNVHQMRAGLHDPRSALYRQAGADLAGSPLEAGGPK